jgi:hypothetical protein
MCLQFARTSVRSPLVRPFVCPCAISSQNKRAFSQVAARPRQPTSQTRRRRRRRRLRLRRSPAFQGPGQARPDPSLGAAS